MADALKLAKLLLARPARRLAGGAAAQVVANAGAQKYTIMFGDSMTNDMIYSTAASPYGTGDNPTSYFVPGAAENVYRAQGFGSHIEPISLGRIRVLKSYAKQTNGVLAAGQTPAGVPLSVQIDRALAEPSVYDLATDVTIMIGVNDAIQGSGTVPVVIAVLKAQIARISKPVYLVSITPLGANPTDAAPGGTVKWLWILAYNQALKRLADESGGKVHFINAYPLINQPTAALDNFAVGMSLEPAINAIHTNNVGAYVIAREYVRYRIPSGEYGEPNIWPSNTYAGTTGAGGNVHQAFSNPTLATASGGTANGGTGTVAAGLTVNVVGDVSYVASVSANTIPDGSGNMQTLAITAGSDGAGAEVRIITENMFNAGGSAFIRTGDVAYSQTLVRVRGGGIAPRNVSLRLNAFAGVNYYRERLAPNAASDKPLPFVGDTRLFLETPVLERPAAAITNLQAQTRIVFDGPGTCTVDLSNIATPRIPA